MTVIYLATERRAQPGGVGPRAPGPGAAGGNAGAPWGRAVKPALPVGRLESRRSQ
jgi:hypothetical protein